MSSEIGYGASAIRSGEVKYQEKIVDLMRQAAAKKPANDTTEEVKQAPPAETHKGRNLDIKA
jgi:hypothetical protein